MDDVANLGTSDSLASQLEKSMKESETLKISLSHYKNALTDANDRLHQMNVNKKDSLSMLDIFKDKSVKRFIENLLIDNQNMKDIISKYVHGDTNAVNLLEEKHILEKEIEKLKASLAFRFTEIQTLKKFIKEDLKDTTIVNHKMQLAELKQENLKLKTYLIFKSNVMDDVKDHFIKMTEDCYLDFMNIASGYEKDVVSDEVKKLRCGNLPPVFFESFPKETNEQNQRKQISNQNIQSNSKKTESETFFPSQMTSLLKNDPINSVDSGYSDSCNNSLNQFNEFRTFALSENKKLEDNVKRLKDGLDLKDKENVKLQSDLAESKLKTKELTEQINNFKSSCTKTLPIMCNKQETKTKFKRNISEPHEHVKWSFLTSPAIAVRDGPKKLATRNNDQNEENIGSHFQPSDSEVQKIKRLIQQNKDDSTTLRSRLIEQAMYGLISNKKELFSLMKSLNVYIDTEQNYADFGELNLKTCQLFVIISNGKFTEESLSKGEKCRANNIPCLFVRVATDDELQSNQIKSKSNNANTIYLKCYEALFKRGLQNYLLKHIIERSLNFPDMCTLVCEALSGQGRECFILSMPLLSETVVKDKVRIFRKQNFYLALTSTLLEGSLIEDIKLQFEKILLSFGVAEFQSIHSRESISSLIDSNNISDEIQNSVKPHFHHFKDLIDVKRSLKVYGVLNQQLVKISEIAVQPIIHPQ